MDLTPPQPPTPPAPAPVTPPAPTPPQPEPVQPLGHVSLAMPSSTPLGNDLSPADASEPKSGPPILKILLFILIPLAILALIGGGGFFFVNNQKKALATNVEDQITQFRKLEDVYKQILDLAKGEDPLNAPQRQTLDILKRSKLARTNPETAVLGLEDSAAITQTRKLIELYKEGIGFSTAIKENNKEISASLGNPLASLYAPKGAKDVVAKTEPFSKDTGEVLGYLEQISQAAITSMQLGVEIGTQLQELLINGADPASVATLQAKVDQLNDLDAVLAKVQVPTPSPALQNYHTAQVRSLEESKRVFNELISALRNQDIEALQVAVNNLLVVAQSQVDNSTVDYVSLWQSEPTLRAVNTIGADWKTLAADLK